MNVFARCFVYQVKNNRNIPVYMAIVMFICLPFELKVSIIILLISCKQSKSIVVEINYYYLYKNICNCILFIIFACKRLHFIHFFILYLFTQVTECIFQTIVKVIIIISIRHNHCDYSWTTKFKQLKRIYFFRRLLCYWKKKQQHFLQTFQFIFL